MGASYAIGASELLVFSPDHLTGSSLMATIFEVSPIKSLLGKRQPVIRDLPTKGHILMKEILVRMMNLASSAGCLLLWKMRGS